MKLRAFLRDQGDHVSKLLDWWRRREFFVPTFIETKTPIQELRRTTTAGECKFMKTIGVRFAILAAHSGEEILVIKMPKSSASNRWTAGRVMNALRAQVPLQRMHLEVVVVDGETIDDPAVFGSSGAAEAHVRGRMSELSGYRWQFLKLKWS